MFRLKQSRRQIKEVFLYGIFGVATTLANIAVYQGMLRLGIDYKISNLTALITTKLFAYVVNKIFVFHSRCENLLELGKEFMRFVLARGATGLIDYFGLMFAVEILSANEVHAKYVITILVIILNYVLGKKAVFHSGNQQNTSEEESA